MNRRVVALASHGLVTKVERGNYRLMTVDKEYLAGSIARETTDGRWPFGRG
ncbi:hypothetical protein ACNS7O_17520 (plasmid) [Haloferacaceae archaeon DSL9]